VKVTTRNKQEEEGKKGKKEETRKKPGPERETSHRYRPE